MIRPWEKFAVIQGQIEIEYVAVVGRTRRLIVAEIGTRQKYPEVLGYTGMELHIWRSDRTRKDSYDAEAVATTVMFPRAFKGAQVFTETGRYTIYLALFLAGRRRNPDAMSVKTEEYCTNLLLNGWK